MEPGVRDREPLVLNRRFRLEDVAAHRLAAGLPTWSRGLTVRPVAKAMRTFALDAVQYTFFRNCFFCFTFPFSLYMTVYLTFIFLYRQNNVWITPLPLYTLLHVTIMPYAAIIHFVGCLTVHLPHEIIWNANLMQQGNFVNVFLARHVSGTYIRRWVAAYGFLHRVLGLVLVLRCTAHTTYTAALKTTTHPKTRCRKPYAATQRLMLLMMGVCTRNMSS